MLCCNANGHASAQEKKGRNAWVGCKHRKDQRFIGGKVVKMVFIMIDEGRMFQRVKLARDRCRMRCYMKVGESAIRTERVWYSIKQSRAIHAKSHGSSVESCGDKGYKLVLMIKEDGDDAFMDEDREKIDNILMIKMIKGTEVSLSRKEIGYGLANHHISREKEHSHEAKTVRRETSRAR